jgi:PhnB protein
MQVNSYLFYNGRCEEALEFYKSAVGASVTALMRFKDSPEPHQPGMIPPGAENKIMHAAFKVGDTEILASDGQCTGQLEFKGFAQALTAGDDAEADRVFNALAQGGQVQMPLTKTFFASKFGMLTDRFGVMWMVLTGH